MQHGSTHTIIWWSSFPFSLVSLWNGRTNIMWRGRGALKVRALVSFSSLFWLYLREETIDYIPPHLIYDGPEENMGDDGRKRRGRPPKSQKWEEVGHSHRPPAGSSSRDGIGKVKVVAIRKGYQRHHSETIRNQVELMEDRIRQKRTQTPDSVVDEEVGKVISDHGHSRSRDLKYAKMVDLYWHVKEMMASNFGRQEIHPIMEKLDQMVPSMMHSSRPFSPLMKRTMDRKMTWGKIKCWMLPRKERKLELLQTPLPWKLMPRNDLQTCRVLYFSMMNMILVLVFLDYSPVSSNTAYDVTCIDTKTVFVVESRGQGNNFYFCSWTITGKNWFFYNYKASA